MPSWTAGSRAPQPPTRRRAERDAGFSPAIRPARVAFRAAIPSNWAIRATARDTARPLHGMGRHGERRARMSVGQGSGTHRPLTTGAAGAGVTYTTVDDSYFEARRLKRYAR